MTAAETATLISELQAVRLELVAMRLALKAHGALIRSVEQRSQVDPLPAELVADALAAGREVAKKNFQSLGLN